MDLSQQTHTRMTKSEELRLLKSADRGDRKALSRLANEGMRLSLLVAQKYNRRNNLGALIKAGFKGWTLAFKHYDRKKDYKFSTYSTWWIKESIEKFLK